MPSSSDDSTGAGPGGTAAGGNGAGGAAARLAAIAGRDLRSADQVTRNVGAAWRQADGFAQVQQDATTRREMLRMITEQRTARPAELAQFHLATEAPTAEHSLVVRGEILVQSHPAPDLPLRERALTDRGFTETGVDLLGGRLRRFRHDDLPAAELVDVARVLRRQGQVASVHNVAVCGDGIVSKAAATPEPTTVDGTIPDVGSGGEVTLAIIDTGLPTAALTHPSLAGVIRADDGIDPLYFHPDGAGGQEYLHLAAGHGSFVAGVVRQLAPQLRVTMYRPFDNSDGMAGELAVAQCMVRAVDEAFEAGSRAVVINLSLGASTVGDHPLLAIESALDEITRRCLDAKIDPDCVQVVASAGNEGSTRPVFPAASRRVLSVAALTADLRPARWSSHGPWVDCSTIGQGIVSTYVPGTEYVGFDPYPDTFGPHPWAMWLGTSFAAPQIAAELARRSQETGETLRMTRHRLLDDAPRLSNFGRVIPLLPGT